MLQRRVHAPPDGGPRAHGPALLMNTTTSRWTTANGRVRRPARAVRRTHGTW